MVHGLHYFTAVIIKLGGMRRGQREAPVPRSHCTSVLRSPDYYSQSIHSAASPAPLPLNIYLEREPLPTTVPIVFHLFIFFIACCYYRSKCLNTHLALWRPRKQSCYLYLAKIKSMCRPWQHLSVLTHRFSHSLQSIRGIRLCSLHFSLSNPYPILFRCYYPGVTLG